MSKDRLIWFKGKLMPAAVAQVPIMSPTAQFGLNVFEGVRGYWNQDAEELFLFRLDAHLDRLMASCRLIGINSPYTSAQIAEATREVLQANSYRTDIAVRITIFVGGDEGSWFDSAPADMFIAPVAKARRSSALREGARACISTWERIDDRAVPPRVKAGANYLNGRYAHLEATAAGYDLPVLIDRQGKISEGAGSCLMMLRDGVLVTPPGTSSVLESITRDTLLTIACDIGMATAVRPIDRTELYLASELFLCGSSAEIIPLTSIDRFTVGEGTMGQETARLLAAYQAAASGASADYLNWLSPVWN